MSEEEGMFSAKVQSRDAEARSRAVWDVLKDEDPRDVDH